MARSTIQISDPLVTSVPWVTKIGHELTFLPKQRFTKKQVKNIFDGDADDTYYDILRSRKSLLREELWTHDGLYDELMIDCGAIEVTSFPSKSWKEHLNFNQVIRTAAEKCKLVPQTDWCPGGGGHHHIDMGTLAQVDNLFRIVAARPYLAWMFLHPEDAKNGLTLNTWFAAHNSYDYENEYCYWVGDLKGMYPAGRGSCITYRCGTNEWRAFDSAVDMEMQIEHTAFIQALVGFSKKTATKAKRSQLFSSVAEAITLRTEYATDFDKCAKEFLEFIELIGLPKNRYEKYIDMYLKPRLDWGVPK